MLSLRVGESSWRKASTPIDINDIVVIHPRKLTGGTWKWGTLEKEIPNFETWNLQITDLVRKWSEPSTSMTMFQPLIFRGVTTTQKKGIYMYLRFPHQKFQKTWLTMDSKVEVWCFHASKILAPKKNGSLKICRESWDQPPTSPGISPINNVFV